MSKHKSVEKTFVMIKPDGVKRGLVGRIFERFESAGLKMIACRMVQATRDQAEENYPGTKEWLIGMGNKTLKNYNGDKEAVKKDVGTADPLKIGKMIYKGLVDYITECPVLITVWEGNHAVERVRKLAGKTVPLEAATGTIRGDFAYDSPMLAVSSGRIVFKNLIHISESGEEAKREIKHWFGDKYQRLDYLRVDHIDMM